MNIRQAYSTEERAKVFRCGFRHAMQCAAEFLRSYGDGSKLTNYRLSDMLLCKFNIVKRKTPRKHRRKIYDACL